MKLNKRTLAIAVTSVASLASVQADEHPVNTALSSTTLYGFVDTAAIWNFGSNSDVLTRFDNTKSDRQDGFNLNAVKLALEKPLDEGTWSAGYKSELWFGPDANGLPGKLGGGDLALKQAYVALRVPVGNGLDFKVGQFDTIVGYETSDSYSNPNFSRSLGFALEPLGHQGVLTTYQFTEIFGASAGVANTWNGPGVNAKVGTQSVKTYMAGVVVKAPESTGWLQGSSLYSGVIDGGVDGKDNDIFTLYVGGTLATPLKGFTLGAGYDYISYKGTGTTVGGNAPLPANGGDHKAFANATSLYASYQLTEQIKLNGRAEYATSSNGVFGTTPNSAENNEEILAYTFTVDYALWANVITRAELRWDHACRGTIGGSGEKNDLSLALNVIYKF